MRTVGLYDSDTGQSLEPIKEVDVSALQTWSDEAYLVYTQARRGRIVQLQSGCVSIHYFYDEPDSRKMIEEDAVRLGFPDILRVVDENAPER